MSDLETKLCDVSDPTCLHCHYDGQTEPQDVYLELRCDDSQLRCDYNAEIGGGVPFTVWHGRTLRFRFALCPTAAGANEFMADDEVKALCGRILAGYESRYDGNNYVGNYTDDAKDAQDELQELIDDYDGLAVEEYDAADWLHDCDSEELGITANTTDDELSAIADKLDDEAHDVKGADGIYVVLEGTYEYLQGRRDELARIREQLGAISEAIRLA